MLRKMEGRRRGQQRMRWLGGNTDLMDMSLSKLRETEKDREVWHAAVHGVKKSRTWLSHWTTNFTQMESFHSALHLLGAKPQVNFSPLVSKVKNLAALISRILSRKLLSIHSFQTVGLTERKDWLSAWLFSSVQFSSVAQSCLTLCDPMNCSMPGLPVDQQLPEFTQTHVHLVSDAIQPSHPLSSPSPPAPNPSQHQTLFQWVNSSSEVDKVLEFQL